MAPVVCGHRASILMRTRGDHMTAECDQIIAQPSNQLKASHRSRLDDDDDSACCCPSHWHNLTRDLGCKLTERIGADNQVVCREGCNRTHIRMHPIGMGKHDIVCGTSQ